MRPPPGSDDCVGTTTPGDAPIYDTATQFSPPAHSASVQPPRAIGTGLVTTKSTAAGSAIDDLRMSGCTKLLFSPTRDRVNAILLNTSGGLTSGDTLTLHATAQQKSALALTTQAAERAYCAPSGPASVTTSLEVENAAALYWLPQELILFNGAHLDRTLTCALSADAKALLVEPVIFGRTAMGEAITDLSFTDRIHVTRNGTPLFRDVTQITGDASQCLGRLAVAAGAGAMVTALYVAPDAEAKHARIAPDLPRAAGASLLHADVLVLRAVASDGLALRRTLLPVLDILTDATLPTSWRL